MPKKKSKFSLTEWETLYYLLNGGFSLAEAIGYLDVSHHLDAIRFYDAYISAHRGNFYRHLKFFYSIQSLELAIKNSLEMLRFRKQLIKTFSKTMFYPIFIFLFAVTLLFFFSRFILPQLMMHFDVVSPLFLFMMQLPLLIQLFLQLLAIFMIILGCIYLFFRKIFGMIVQFFIQKISLFQMIYSYYFVGYYQILIACGLSNKQIIEYLLALHQNQIFHQMIQKIYDEQNQGKSLLACIQAIPLLTKQTKHSFKIGLNTNKILLFLEQEKKMCVLNIERKIKKYTIIMQFFAYSIVLLVVLIMYQMMMIPLDMIQNL